MFSIVAFGATIALNNAIIDNIVFMLK